jgi:formate hydrogenlyase transcriptional activator
LTINRSTDDAFLPEEAGFLKEASGPIAIAIENCVAFSEISELKEKLAQVKLYLEEEIRGETNFEQIVGSSPALKHVLPLVETVAPSDSTVLLLGETGTGKELIARAIHGGLERSRDREVAVFSNCENAPSRRRSWR